MSRKPVFFVVGFVAGALLSLLWNAMPILGAGGAPDIPGIWLDIAIQAIVVGLVIGLIALFLAGWRRNRT